MIARGSHDLGGDPDPILHGDVAAHPFDVDGILTAGRHGNDRSGSHEATIAATPRAAIQRPETIADFT